MTNTNITAQNELVAELVRRRHEVNDLSAVVEEEPAPEVRAADGGADLSETPPERSEDVVPGGTGYFRGDNDGDVDLTAFYLEQTKQHPHIGFALVEGRYVLVATDINHRDACRDHVLERARRDSDDVGVRLIVNHSEIIPGTRVMVYTSRQRLSPQGAAEVLGVPLERVFDYLGEGFEDFDYSLEHIGVYPEELGGIFDTGVRLLHQRLGQDEDAEPEPQSAMQAVRIFYQEGDRGDDIGYAIFGTGLDIDPIGDVNTEQDVYLGYEGFDGLETVVGWCQIERIPTLADALGVPANARHKIKESQLPKGSDNWPIDVDKLFDPDDDGSHEQALELYRSVVGVDAEPVAEPAEEPRAEPAAEPQSLDEVVAVVVHECSTMQSYFVFKPGTSNSSIRDLKQAIEPLGFMGEQIKREGSVLIDGQKHQYVLAYVGGNSPDAGPALMERVHERTGIAEHKLFDPYLTRDLYKAGKIDETIRIHTIPEHVLAEVFREYLGKAQGLAPKAPKESAPLSDDPMIAFYQSLGNATTGVHIGYHSGSSYCPRGIAFGNVGKIKAHLRTIPNGLRQIKGEGIVKGETRVPNVGFVFYTSRIEPDYQDVAEGLGVLHDKLLIATRWMGPDNMVPGMDETDYEEMRNNPDWSDKLAGHFNRCFEILYAVQ